MASKRTIPVTELMDTPAERDEVGTPDHLISECDRDGCDVLFRRGGDHRCQALGEWVTADGEVQG